MRPKVQVNAYQFDGPMAYLHSGSQPTYATNSYGRPWSDQEGPAENGWEADGALVRQAYQLREDDDDFGQAGTLVREVFDDAQRERLVQTVAGAMGEVQPEIRARVFEYWRNVDQDLGHRIQQAAQASVGTDQYPGLQEPADEFTSLKEEPGDAYVGVR